MTESVHGIHIPEKLTWKLNFLTWIDRWNAATDVPTAIGLLHIIYNSNHGEKEYRDNHDTHRALFLLELADGHRSDSRSGLATKAFDVLASHLFKNLHSDTLRCLSTEVANKLLDFFISGTKRVASYYCNVRWIDADGPQSREVSHADRVASVFMRKFCESCWTHGSEQQRMRIVELLYEQRALETLVPEHDYRGWKEFTPAVLQKLEECTKLVEHYRYASKDPSLEEMIYHGDKAAQVLLLVRAGKEGEAKEKRRKELQQQLEEGQKELQKL